MPEITIQTATIAPLLTSTFHLNCPASPPAQTFYPSILNNKLFFQHQTHLEVNEKYLTKVLTKPDVIQEWWKKSEVKSQRSKPSTHIRFQALCVTHIYLWADCDIYHICAPTLIQAWMAALGATENKTKQTNKKPNTLLLCHSAIKQASISRLITKWIHSEGCYGAAMSGAK